MKRRRGKPAYGFAFTDTGTIPNEIQLEIVRTIFAMRGKGSTLQAIADYLMAAKVPAPKGGRVWKPQTVVWILKHRRLYSKFLGRGEKH